MVILYGLADNDAGVMCATVNVYGFMFDFLHIHLSAFRFPRHLNYWLHYMSVHEDVE